MKARLPLASLLATTSVAALLATTSGAFADGTTVSSPTTNVVVNSNTDFISIQTAIANTDGLDGLVVSGATIGYNGYPNNISNADSGSINVSDADSDGGFAGSLNGILVTDDAQNYAGIYNAGPITVDAEVSGFTNGSITRDAAGIRGEDNSSIGDIANSSTISVTAKAFDLSDGDTLGTDDQFTYAGASAFGIDFTGQNSSFNNSGSVDVTSQAQASARTDYDQNAYAVDMDESGSHPGETYSFAGTHAQATGVHFAYDGNPLGYIASSVTNEEDSTITTHANATASTYATIDVACTTSSEEGCSTPGQSLADAHTTVTAVSHGVNVEGSAAKAGDFYNAGTITANANGIVTTYASAQSDNNESASARAGAHRDYYDEDEYYNVDPSVLNQDVSGVRYDTLRVDSLSNDGTITSNAQATGFNSAIASAEGWAEAEAGVAINQQSKGLEIDAMLINGGIDNTGRIEANATTFVGASYTEGSEPYYAPSVAQAISGYDAEAENYAQVHTYAVGVDVNSTAMTDDFHLHYADVEDDGVFATVNLSSNLLAEATATTSGDSSGTSYAEALVGPYVSAHAAGVAFNVENLSGHFINEGRVDAAINTNTEQSALTHSYGEGDAGAYAQIIASATGIEVDGQNEDGTTISGSFINEGEVSAEANLINQSEATADGSGDLEAQAGGTIYGQARGLDLHLDKLQDNFHGESNLIAAANVESGARATSTSYRGEDEGDDTYGDAVAYAGGSEGDTASVVGAQATGLYFIAGTVGGHIETDATISTQAIAAEDYWADAYAGNDGDAYARAESNLQATGVGAYIDVLSVGTSLEYVEDVDQYDGYVVNAGLISTDVRANSQIKATADADEGNATAYAVSDNSSGDENATVNTTGYVVTSEGSSAVIAGSVLNFGEIQVEGGVDATLSALAHTHEGDEDSVAAALGGGAYSTYGQGYVLDGLDIEVDNSSEEGGGFFNAGNIYVDLTNETEINAEATSDDGSAVAMIGRYIGQDGPLDYYSEGSNINSVDGTGLAVADTYIDGDFVNAGFVGISATAFSDLYAKAKGDEDGLGQATIIDEVSSNAYGIRIDNLHLEGDVSNSGAVYAFAGAGVSSTADAIGNEAYATIGRGEESANQADANVTGFKIHSTGSIDFINAYDGEDPITSPFESEEGMIFAWATAGSSSYAHAVGSDVATANVYQSDSANAVGVDLSMNESGEGQGFNFTNQGGIFAMAGVGVYEEEEERHEAYANSSGYADANVEYQTQAAATGVSGEFINFDNSGVIAAQAISQAQVYAHADADGGTASAEADVSSSATAVGVYFYGQDSDGTFNNSGAISASASALAYAHAAIGSSDDTEDYNADAFASASAVGVEVTEYSRFDSFTNTSDGVISAQANASASEQLGTDEATPGSAYANAWGLYIGYDTVFNTIQNDGEISASATAASSAHAYGLEVREAGDNTFAGVITNTGTISAHASSENPYATAILVSDGSYISLIENSGTISATIDDTSDVEPFDSEGSHAIAIDIRGAGMPTQINQLAGAIVGDVHMENAYLNTLNWSGGTITGDIYGDHDTDYMNVYSSVVGDTTYNDFTYNGVIDGLYDFSVNGGDHNDAVALRLTNQVREVANFNVGPNATVTLGSAATVQTDALNLDAAATLAFDVTTDGANGVINTGTADLGGARVRANFVDPVLPDTGTYRIINWDEKSDTEFASVVSNSVLEQVRAEYGDDGVDLLVQRLKFVQVAGLGDDATSLSKALDKTFGDIDPDSDIGQAIRLLIQLTPDQYAYELEQIAGQQTADLQHVTATQLGSLIHVIQTQINEARTLTGPTGGDGASISVGNKKMSFSSSDDVAPMTGAAAGDPVLKGDWKAWARVFGDWSKLDASNTAAGYKSDSGGAVVGIDYAVSDGLSFGLAGGYQSTNLDFAGTGDGDIKSWSVTAYGDYEFGNAYVDGLVGYSAQKYDMNRYLNILGTPYTANSQYDGTSLIGALEAGYKFAIAGDATLTPFIGINGTSTDNDGASETGAGVWNLTYDDRSDSQIDSVLGARISRDYKMDGGMKLTPTFELGWKHGFGDTSPTSNAALSGVPGSQFQIFASDTAADAAIVGAALQVQMTDAVDAYVQYNGQYSSDFTENTASLRLRVKF